MEVDLFSNPLLSNKNNLIYLLQQLYKIKEK